MNRPDRMISEAEALQILQKGTLGVLSVASPDGVPYGVPVNYFFSLEERAIYFHCFVRGRKLDYIQQNPMVSFLVIGDTEIIPDRFVTHYESVIVSGRASLITDDQTKTDKILQLCQRLAPTVIERRDQVIAAQLAAVTIVRIAIEQISGKRNQDY